jgi:hypothetical protein
VSAGDPDQGKICMIFDKQRGALSSRIGEYMSI